MNLLLFNEKEILGNNTFSISGRRAEHLIRVLKAKEGQKIRAGMIDRNIGDAQIINIKGDTIQLTWQERQSPPPRLPCILVLALPRPKMLNRILQTAASMGVKEIHLINTWKVDKSYWKSPRLDQQKIRSNLLIGLEQATDCILPKVYLHRLFKPFAEDRLPGLCTNRCGLVAHPYAEKHCPINLQGSSTLSMGPEGGFTEYEIELLQRAGMTAVNIGPRILRVETAVPAVLGRLHPEPRHRTNGPG